MPAIPPCIIEPIWQQFTDLLSDRKVDHPLGCHRLVGETCSATTPRRRRDERNNAGMIDKLLITVDRLVQQAWTNYLWEG